MYNNISYVVPSAASVMGTVYLTPYPSYGQFGNNLGGYNQRDVYCKCDNGLRCSYPGQHRCICLNDSIYCYADEHVCKCEFSQPRDCQSYKHACICTEGMADLCRAFQDDHWCSCDRTKHLDCLRPHEDGHHCCCLLKGPLKCRSDEEHDCLCQEPHLPWIRPIICKKHNHTVKS